MFKFIKNAMFQRMVKKAIADHVITDKEMQALERYQEKMALSQRDAEKAYAKAVEPVAIKLAERVIDRVRKTRRFSPADERRIQNISKQLKFPLDYSPLRVYRKLWEIENTGEVDLEPMEVDIRLARNEVCYHACPAVWHQMATVRKRHGYAGGSVGFRVSKNVTLRFGGFAPIGSTSEELKEMSHGDLYVTSKKLVFVGDRRSTTITYGRLARWEMWQDALSVEKNTGKPDVFQMEAGSIEYIDAVLQAV